MTSVCFVNIVLVHEFNGATVKQGCVAPTQETFHAHETASLLFFKLFDKLVNREFAVADTSLVVCDSLVCLATAMQNACTPQVHVAEQCIDCSVGNHTLGLFLLDEAVASLSGNAFNIGNQAVHDIQNRKLGEVFHVAVAVYHLGGVGNALECTYQIEVAQGTHGHHFCSHLAPFCRGELLVLFQNLLAMLQYLVAVSDGCVHATPVII